MLKCVSKCDVEEWGEGVGEGEVAWKQRNIEQLKAIISNVSAKSTMSLPG